MKIGSPVYGNCVNTSGLHGAAQNSKAVDMYGSERALEFRAVADGKVIRQFDLGTKYEGVDYLCDCGLKLEYVHCKAPAIGTRFAQGDKIGNSVLDHLHIACEINGVWYPIWDFTDRSVKYQSTTGEVWEINTLPEFENRDANTGLIINDTPMIQIDQLPTFLKLTAINTTTFNIRLAPKLDAQDIGDVPVGYVWYTNAVAYGDAVDGNNKWYQIAVPSGDNARTVGYCSAAYVKEETLDLIQMSADIASLSIQISSLKATINDLNTKLDTCTTQLTEQASEIAEKDAEILELKSQKTFWDWLVSLFKK